MTYLTRDTLRALASAKLRDAELLLKHNRCSNAYYLSGYAIELMLKGEIARSFLKDTLPDLALVRSAYTHELRALLGLSGLKAELDESGLVDARLAANWLIVSQWSETSRYEMVDEFRAVEMVKAVGDADHGVFSWLMRH